MAAFSSDSEDNSYQPGNTLKKQAKEKRIEKDRRKGKSTQK